MILIEDVAQKNNKHIKKNDYWKSQNVTVLRHPLPCGDYILVNDAVQELLNRKAKRGIEPKKMDFLGTYDVCVDSKFGMQEIVGNLCGKGHDRVRDEAMLAKNNGIKLIFLIEDDGGYVDRKQTIYNKPCACIEDVFSWRNPRLFIMQYGKQKYPKAVRGKQLAKTMITFASKYDCEFKFCRSKEAGQKIIELLEGATE